MTTFYLILTLIAVTSFVVALVFLFKAIAANDARFTLFLAILVLLNGAMVVWNGTSLLTALSLS